MKLHTNKQLFQDAIIATARSLKLRELYIEKDYWVTLALYEVFNSSIASEAVFKGGTALSKCHRMIDRFSEDIDLVVLRRSTETDNQLKKKLRTISKTVEKVMPEVSITGITNKKGNIRKTAHNYDRIFDGDFGPVRGQIVLEATWLGNYEPFSVKTVSSYIYDMIVAQGQNQLIEEYQLMPFEVQVLCEFRTFCEKIMSLVRFSHTENPIEDLRNKVRHIYDLNQMMKEPRIKEFVDGKEFNAMLLQVGRDDIVSFKNNNDWVELHPSTALIFQKPVEAWQQIRPAYFGTFSELVFGSLPSDDSIKETLMILSRRIKEVEWSVRR